jgi:methanogenic corrinoid protein MtbC1
MTCLITGCALINGSSTVHGDLHEVGDTLVFNACLSNGEAAWRDIDVNISPRQIDITNSDYFERRGVFVIPVGSASLSEAAITHIEAGKRLPL